MSADGTAAVIRAYYDAWTSKDFDQAVALLGPDLTVEVPVNDYPDTESFATALRSFGSLAASAELLAAMSSGEEGMLLYDMDVPGLGRLRVAEHLTVKDGKITRLRQIHDTAAIRAAGFARSSRDTMAAPRERG